MRKVKDQTLSNPELMIVGPASPICEFSLISDVNPRDVINIRTQ